MKTPIFWSKITFISLLLMPLSYVYRFGTLLRNFFAKPEKINKPIICIGNLTAGGAGKTPVAIEIGKMLVDLGVQFSYLGHGYKAGIEDMVLVDSGRHVSSQVGDEAILLSEVSSTFISKNKVFGAKQIAKMPDEELIVMDDGLQNPNLVKDLSIVVVDGGYGFGNGLIFPAGPLRQEINNGAEKSDLVICIGEDKFGSVKKHFGNKKTMFVKTNITNKSVFKGKKLVAFCGIGRPSKFFETLEEAGLTVIGTFEFSDHYSYEKHDLKKLLNVALEKDADLITTKKDWVRLDDAHRKQIKYLDIELKFKAGDKNYIKSLLKDLTRRGGDV